MSKKYIKVFEVEGMPDGEEEQNFVAHSSIRSEYYHVHNDDGEYYIVHITSEDANGCDSIKKLDPEDPIDAEKLNDLKPVLDDILELGGIPQTLN